MKSLSINKIIIGRQRIGCAAQRRQGIALFLSLLLLCLMPAGASAQQSTPAAPAGQTSYARTAAEAVRLVTEFEVNGLKVLVKRRESSQTVVDWIVHARRREQCYG